MKTIVMILASMTLFLQFAQAEELELAAINDTKEDAAMRIGANQFAKDVLSQIGLPGNEMDAVDQATADIKQNIINDLKENGVRKLDERAIAGRIYPLPILLSGLEVEVPNLLKFIGVHAKGQLYIAGIKFINPKDMSTHYKYSMLRILGGGLTATFSKEKPNIKASIPLVGSIEMETNNTSKRLIKDVTDLNGVYGGAGAGGSFGFLGGQWLIYRSMKNVIVTMPTVLVGSDRAPGYAKAEALYLNFSKTEHQGYWSAVGEAAKSIGGILDKSNSDQ